MNNQPANRNRPTLHFVPLIAILVLSLAGEALAANFVVRMQGNRFVPRDITISVGDSITWTNLDFSSHDSVSGTNGVASGFWRTPLFGRNGSATVFFTNLPPRSYGYYCTPHVSIGMVGSVTVRPPNTLPVVSIIEPAPGAIVPAGVPLPIRADALDSDGRIVRVEFSVDGTFIGSDLLGPFTVTYANPTPGPHNLRVVAVDDRAGTSAPVVVPITAVLPPAIVQPPANTNVLEFSPASFSVIATGAPPLSLQWQFNGADIPGATNETHFIPSARTTDEGNYAVVVSNIVGSITSPSALLSVTPNILPVVTLTSPTNGQLVASGSTVSLLADASDPDGSIMKVEFFLGTNLVATVSNTPYAASLTNVPPGVHQIVARALDDLNGAAFSSSVEITVLSPPTITITAPAPGSVLPVGTPILLSYQTNGAVPPDGVELFTNESSLGDSNVFLPAVPGVYLLSGIVTDVVGQRGTSAPVAIRVYLEEQVRPSLTITSSPPNFARLTNTSVLLAGTARDDVGLLFVAIEHSPSGRTNLAHGTSNWWAEIDLVPGPNTIYVRSVDQASNSSPRLARYFTRVVMSPLTVLINGDGTVTPDYDELEIGKVYRLTAKPGRDQIFAGWDDAPGLGAVRDFVMQSDLVLTANFMPNPFGPVAGEYSGLIRDTNSFAPDANGLVTFKVAKSGAFSGRFRSAGRNQSFRGQLTHHGSGEAIALRRGETPVHLELHLDMTGADDAVIGSATDGEWLAGLLAYRNPYASGTNGSPHAGSRSFYWRDQDSNALIAATVGSSRVDLQACKLEYSIVSPK